MTVQSGARARPMALEVPHVRLNAWLLCALVLALFIGELPKLLAACCAPAGATGLGTAWFVNDFAQYESAMRQGAEQSGWLIYDPFTAEPHPAAFMFPLYVGIGKLAATLHVSAGVVEHAVEIGARALLVVALWRFCAAFTHSLSAARWAFGLALFASGFEVFGAALGGYSGNWSYELNGFGLLFAAPHVPLAMAATLELARDALRPLVGARVTTFLKIGLLSAVIALLHPFHEPVLLAAIGLVGLMYWRTDRGIANPTAAIVAGVAAVPVLWPTAATFSLDPFWGSTYTLQNVLPSPAPHELLIDLGATLVLAVAGAVLLRGQVAPFGLLLWVLLCFIAIYVPVPFQRRFGFGVEPALAVLAANGLAAISVRLQPRLAQNLRLGVVALAACGTVLIAVSVVASSLNNAPLRVYRSNADLDAAAAWLSEQALPTDVILADWNASNYLAARTPARVFGGHPVATLHPDQKQFEIASVFAHPSSTIVARALGVQWLVYGPEEANLAGPRAPAAFRSGAVRVYQVRR